MSMASDPANAAATAKVAAVAVQALHPLQYVSPCWYKQFVLPTFRSRVFDPKRSKLEHQNIVVVPEELY